MNKFKNMFGKFSIILLFLSLMVFSGCVSSYKTPIPDTNPNATEGEYVKLPKSLGYSVRALEVSQGLYNNVLISANDLYNEGEIEEEQVNKIVEIASRYKAAHNTAQTAVSTWFVAYTMNNENFNKNEAMSEILKLVAMTPEIVDNINAIVGEDIIKIPAFFNLEKLMDMVNKDDSIDVDTDSK